MKNTIQLLCAFGLFAAVVSAPAEDVKTNSAAVKATNAPAAKEVAIIKTSEGEITVEFWSDVAPKTVENFKKLAKQGFYDGTASHRMIPGFMVQMGCPNTKDASKESIYGQGDPGYKINAEFNERKHERGVLSMARSRDPNSAGSQFFICFGSLKSLDGQYTTFGKVIKGMEVLEKIEKLPIEANPHTGENSKPKTRIAVESIKIVTADTVKK